MADRLYLSVWLAQYSTLSVLQALRAALTAFPYSKDYPGVRSFLVHPLDWSEPVVMERDFVEGADVDTIMELVAESEHDDSAYETVVCWDLTGGPKVVKIIAYAPDFEGREDERGHLEFDLGMETPFLADQRNISMLIALNRILGKALPPHKRHLWTESGANFADKVAETLE